MSFWSSLNQILFLSFIYVLGTKSTIASLTINVSPVDNLINVPSTYTWNVEYSNNISRLSFALYFPTCIQITSSTNVFFNSVQLTIAGFNTNNINFTFPSAVASEVYVFTLNNVNNCYQAKSVRQFKVWNNADGIAQQFTGVNTILFKEGTIPSCQLKFNGKTADISSVLDISFKIQNLVRGSVFGIRINFNPYYSSNTKLLAIDNFTCSLKINGSSLLNLISKTLDTINNQLSCAFSTNSSSITVNDNFNLILTNVNNPITSTIYLSSNDFVLTTFDVSEISIDKTMSFTLIPVPISNFSANFSLSRGINKPMFPIRLSTTANIPFRIFKNDQILIQYTSGFFSTNGSQLFVGRTGGFTPISFAYKTPVNPTILALNFINNGTGIANTINAPIDIQLPNFIYTMPPSTKPVTFKIIFSGTGSLNVSDQFMQIDSTLVPYYSNISQSQLNLSLSVNTIGDNSTYTFTFVNLEKLDQKPKIIIDFPSQINISNSASLSLCSIQVNHIGIGTKTCQFVSPNSVQINFTSSSPIIPNSIMVFALPNIKNPSSPISVSGFNIKTYYTSDQPEGLVQVGQNLNMNLSYGPRTVYPYIPTDNFTVFTDQKNFTLVYQTGVDLPNGSVVTITFNNLLKNILFMQCNPLKFSLTQNASNIFILTSNEAISSGTILNITFSCSTPNRTGIYSVLSLLTTFNNVPYQKTQSDVTFQVITPYYNIFTVTPANNSTGMITSYTFSFTTIVPHESIIIVEIAFPSGTDLINGQSFCNLGCNSSNISDSSSGSMDKLQVILYKNISGLTAPYVYTFTLNNIKNQREVGNSGDFQFITLTNETRQKILRGISFATITTPSLITARFFQSDDYYKQNTNPVKIQFNLTNKLQVGDYISFIFTVKSYTPLNGLISCAEGTCTIQNLTTTFFELKFIPSITQIIQRNIFVEVYGLLSASDTIYGQLIPVSIISKSSNNKFIDEGSFNYRVSCGQNLQISNKNCKTCIKYSTVNYNCTSCYSPQSLFQNDLCTPNCSNLSSLSTYSSNGFCIPCVIPCESCLNQTYCTRCITGFYLVSERHTCQSSCNTSSGYYVFLQFSTYLFCQKCTALNCISCPNDKCDACFGTMVVENGACLGGCIDGTFNLGGVCTRCDPSCLTCNGISNLNCFSCSPTYFSFSGACISGCPSGSVNTTNGTCGCGVSCGTCRDNENKCLSCRNISFFLYNFTCSEFCSNGTYAFGKQCLNCSSGCNKCSSTTCIQCENNFNIFQNKCYQNCKQIGPRFISRIVNGVFRCDQCPNGCSNCTDTFVCLQCIQSYILNGTVCKRQCQLTNTCDLTPVVDPIIPLPGLISFGIWVIIIVILKLVFIKSIYPPYALLFAGALIQYILLVTNVVQISIKYSGFVGRLLQTTQDSSVLVTPLGLIAVGLLLNYVMNIILIWIFKKFIKPLIIPRQIDLISNYVAFIFSVLTTYRFYLLAFCRLFKKPHVQVKSSEKIAIFRRILAVSYLLDLIPFVGAIILVSSSTKLSILYMLGIDLILIIVFLWAIFIWTVIWDKPEQYYSETKKYALQENHMTEQASIQNNEKEISKAQIRNDTSEKLNIQQYVGEDNIDNMPTKQTNFIHVEGKKPEKIDSVMEESGYKTRRRQKKDEPFEKSSEKKIGWNEANKLQDLQKKKASDQHNKQISQRLHRDQFSVLEKKKLNHPLSPKKQQLGLESGKKNGSEIYEFDDNEIQFEKELNIAQRPTKLKPAMKSSTKIDKPLVTGMKKKKTTGAFQSQMGESQIDQVDLESILQTKVIDRSKNKTNQGQAHTEVGKNDHHEYEEISPSWFNIQNQRYDINESYED